MLTGQSAEGRSVLVRDEELQPISAALLGAQELNLIWAGDGPFALPNDGSPSAAAGFYPPPGGLRYWYFTLPPDTVGLPDDLDVDAATAEANERLPGLLDVLEAENPRMHTTDTVDIDLVVSGEVWLELDDGVEVHLRAGDCAVINGNRHAWRNRSSRTSVIAVAIVGAQRSEVGYSG